MKTVTFRRDYSGWLRINIKSAADEWIKRSNKNFGLQVVVTDERGHELNPFDVLEHYDCNAGSPSTYVPIRRW